MPDDGTADAAVRSALADSEMTTSYLARLLRHARLLATVVAVLDEADEAGADKDSHMAVVSMLNERGERGMLAFSGVDSLALWNAAARPVPALGRDIARSAIAEGSSAIVIDVGGPSRAVLAGSSLEILADTLDLAVAAEAITAVTGAAVVVHDARASGLGVDVAIEVPDDDMVRIAALLAADDRVRAVVPGGVAVVASGSMAP